MANICSCGNHIDKILYGIRRIEEGDDTLKLLKLDAFLILFYRMSFVV